MLKVKNEEIKCDLLVIGGGIAGCLAAIAAKEIGGKDLEVVLTDKGWISRTGQSPLAAGIYTFFHPEEDDMDLWLEEIISSGEYINNQHWCKQLFERSSKVAFSMDSWAKDYGKEIFIKNVDGSFQRRRSRGHIQTKHMMMNSLSMMDVLRKKLNEIGVKIIDRIMVTDLLAEEGSVQGAVGFDYRHDANVLFKSRAIILSASGCGFKAPGIMGHRNLTGDLQAAALEVGASFANMEQFTSNTTARNYDIHGLNLYVSVGGKFVNAQGEEFMWRYDPVLGNRAPLQKLALSFAREVQEGRGPIYLDLTSASKEDEDLCRRLLPESFKLWDRAAANPFKHKTEWTIAFKGTTASGGGIKIDMDCFTGVPGLYAAGDITWIGPHGTYSFGGINIGYCAVSGDLAGRRAAEFLEQKTEEKPLNKKYAQEVTNKTLLPLIVDKGFSPEEAIHRLQEAIISIDVCYLKSKESINKAMEKVTTIKEEVLPQVKANNSHQLVKALEFRSMIPVAEMMLIASLTREESRGFHFREEFPYTDNKNWLKLVLISKKGNKQFEVTTQPVDTPYITPKEERTLSPGIPIHN